MGPIKNTENVPIQPPLGEDSICFYFSGNNAWTYFKKDSSLNTKEEYRLDGKMHNTAGPAYVSSNGEVWFIDGKKHRIGAPAIIRTEQFYIHHPEATNSPNEEYWLNGKKCTREEYDILLRARAETERGSSEAEVNLDV